MANTISYDARPDLRDVGMSNGLTAVFISVLSLASSALAQIDRQRELAAWFASHDQGVFGGGLVGFDLCDVPWRAESFEADRDFILRAVDAAKAHLGWDRLAYEPREDWVQDRLDRFRVLITAFDIAHAEADPESDWRFGGRPAAFTLCEQHLVYRHSVGCPVCND